MRSLTTVMSIVAAAAAFAGSPANAATLIDFEGVTSFASVSDYYNGGTDSAGAGGSANVGVAFSGAALALSNDALGPYFSHAPTAGSVMFASDATALMNVASGFVGEVSFWYSASMAALDVVQIYAGADGSGAVLGRFSLSENAQLGCSDTAYCNWQRTSLTFNGIGRSIGFGGNVGGVAFDNVSVTAVPEPASWLLLACGAAGLLVTRRLRSA